MLRPHELNGVFLGSHAVAAGVVTRKQLTLFRRLMHNVYADPALPAEHQLAARGAALLFPADGVLGGRSAACWYGAPFASAVDPVRVIVPPDSSWRGPKGVLVHRTSLRPADRTIVDDIPMTSPVRTAWDVATVDLAWPDAKLVVEYEGAYHFDGVQIVKDDARYERLVAAGWRVIRVSAADLRDVDSLVARIAHARASARCAG